ncbi:MAG: ADP-ribosylglycohydrolase family protein [Roseibacillus sp.]
MGTRLPGDRSIPQFPHRLQLQGYVIESLDAALWAFWNSSSFREGALMAVNLGDDADTTGAIFGQLAGAHYGADRIPDGWISKLAWRDRLTRIADRLHDTAASHNPSSTQQP